MLILLTLASAQEQKHEKPKPLALPEDRAADTYDVYDAALPKPIWGQPYQGAKYYIVDRVMKAGIGWQRDNCFKPPNELRVKVEEMLDDLSKQPDAYILEPRFKLNKPYQFVKSGGHDVPSGESGVALGIVSFSKDRSLASVVVWTSCGQLCGGSQWKVLTREKKGWEEQPWSACGAIF
jgi:hypothetical protein